MALSVLLDPQSKNADYLHLYAHEVEAKILDVDTVTINTLDVTDLNVSGDAIISGVNYKTINGVGTNGQVLTSNGLGDVLWETNAGGDVSGPVSSVNDNIASFNGVNGKVIKDSGIQSSNLALLNADVFFNSVTTDHAIETDGAQLVLNDGIGAGSAVLYLQSAGVTQKAIQLNSNNLEFVNSAFNNICLMNESKNTEFFGNVKVDGNLTQTNVTGQGMEYTGTISVAVNPFFNAYNNPVNSGQAAQSPLTDEVVAVNSKIVKFCYNTTSGDGTSSLQIYKNGAGQGAFLLSGTSGVISLSINCSSADKIAVKQEAGTDIGLSNISLQLISV